MASGGVVPFDGSIVVLENSMRLQAPAIAHSREERRRFTRPDCFGNTDAAIYTAVTIGIGLIHDWRDIGSIHINSSIKTGGERRIMALSLLLLTGLVFRPRLPYGKIPAVPAQ